MHFHRDAVKWLFNGTHASSAFRRQMMTNSNPNYLLFFLLTKARMADSDHHGQVLALETTRLFYSVSGWNTK